MQTTSFSLLVGLGLGLVRVQAAPSPIREGVANNFINTCSDIYYENSWLVATCSADDGTAVTSSIMLSSLIQNNASVLQWAANGGFYTSCYTCSLQDSSLTCQCGQDSAGFETSSTIDLIEHISVYNGYLLSDLAGEPTGPTVQSSISTTFMPSSFQLKLGIYDQQWSSDCATEDTTEHGISLVQYTPEACHTYNLLTKTANSRFLAPPPYVAVKSVVNAGWKITAYGNQDCSGDAVASFDYTSLFGEGQCLTLGGLAAGFKIEPLWNAFWL